MENASRNDSHIDPIPSTLETSRDDIGKKLSTGAKKDPRYEGAEDFLTKFGEILKESVNRSGEGAHGTVKEGDEETSVVNLVNEPPGNDLNTRHNETNSLELSISTDDVILTVDEVDPITKETDIIATLALGSDTITA